VIFIFYMKYLITESQINNLIFLYLDGQGLVQTEKDNKIYFKKFDGDNISQIVYDTEREVCKLGNGVINQVSDFFSMDKSDSKELIGKWVEKTLKMNVSSIKPLSAAQTRVGGIWS